MSKSTAPPPTTTLYAYGLADHPIAEMDTTGAAKREYFWLGDMPVAVLDVTSGGGATIYDVHVDHLMWQILMTDQSQTWAWYASYKPFGEVASLTSNPAVMNARFPGQWFQLETELHYNWHRHYDPTIGRYVQPDPLKVDDGDATLTS